VIKGAAGTAWFTLPVEIRARQALAGGGIGAPGEGGRGKGVRGEDELLSRGTIDTDRCGEIVRGYLGREADNAPPPCGFCLPLSLSLSLSLSLFSFSLLPVPLSPSSLLASR